MVKVGPRMAQANNRAGMAPVEPDMSLLSELYEEMERNPPGIEARKLLIEQFMTAGWMEAAQDAVQELLKLKPRDSEVKALAQTLRAVGKQPNPAVKPAEPPPVPRRPFRAVPATALPKDREMGKKQLLEGYESLLEQAKSLLRETTLLRDLSRQSTESQTQASSSSILSVLGSFFSGGKTKEDSVSARFEKHIPDLVAIADGRVSTVVRARQPGSVRSVARAMEAKPQEAVDIAFRDLEDMARWLSSPTNSTSPLDNDGVREALVKRVRTLEAALSDKLKPHGAVALMHVEHEVLRKKYIGGDSTMLGDPVSEIPRDSFYVTEDGYAWDLSELSQAISSNGGVMRNPLSHQMFTTNDIRAIVQHPLGKHLAALEIEQKKLKLGIRPKTIDNLDKLQTILLADQSADSIPSRHAVDDFMAYLATLPMAEQNAVDKLRVPATDTHTGQKFDTSIGDAVRDAQGNRVCFHKTGDLIRQAVQHLRKKR